MPPNKVLDMGFDPQAEPSSMCISRCLGYQKLISKYMRLRTGSCCIYPSHNPRVFLAHADMVEKRKPNQLDSDTLKKFVKPQAMNQAAPWSDPKIKNGNGPKSLKSFWEFQRPRSQHWLHLPNPSGPVVKLKEG